MTPMEMPTPDRGDNITAVEQDTIGPGIITGMNLLLLERYFKPEVVVEVVRI